MKKSVNLIYFRDATSTNGNFGDELSKFITSNLINNEKYELFFRKRGKNYNLVCIGSYIHEASNNAYIFGSGIRTNPPIENGHYYQNLNVSAIRGPLSREFLMSKNINVPEIYGDPGLLLSKFYQPKINESLKDKIGIVPHKSNYAKYVNKIDKNIYHLINPTDKWETVINELCSCKSIISSSLHGLVCADAYNIPNLWLDEYKLSEGDFKFKDYFASQGREYVKIRSINEYKESLLYTEGNKVNLDKLVSAFPFK